MVDIHILRWLLNQPKTRGTTLQNHFGPTNCITGRSPQRSAGCQRHEKGASPTKNGGLESSCMVYSTWHSSTAEISPQNFSEWLQVVTVSSLPYKWHPFVGRLLQVHSTCSPPLGASWGFWLGMSLFLATKPINPCYNIHTKNIKSPLYWARSSLLILLGSLFEGCFLPIEPRHQAGIRTCLPSHPQVKAWTRLGNVTDDPLLEQHSSFSV